MGGRHRPTANESPKAWARPRRGEARPRLHVPGVDSVRPRRRRDDLNRLLNCAIKPSPELFGINSLGAASEHQWYSMADDLDSGGLRRPRRRARGGVALNGVPVGSRQSERLPMEFPLSGSGLTQIGRGERSSLQKV
jgi:hypothetical protein